ncbi:hypothetical protein FQN55_007322 [Onygenales sp. PD_40]|nr:hypothetical protein FQN55_007322 [Onygenales sp. PD_40]KAK2782360.1 hypothetical protein FQN53_009794 [Emmonsiellopsis sp. PD_33]
MKTAILIISGLSLLQAVLAGGSYFKYPVKESVCTVSVCADMVGKDCQDEVVFKTDSEMGQCRDVGAKPINAIFVKEQGCKCLLSELDDCGKPLVDRITHPGINDLKDFKAENKAKRLSCTIV